MNKLIADIVRNDEQLFQIHELNMQNIRTNLSEEEKNAEGFVSWIYPIDLLQKMHGIAPSIIVRDDEKVAGYALVATKEMRPFHSDLQGLFDHLSVIHFDDRPLIEKSFYCMGQICVDKNYRGQGIASKLYQKHKEIYGKRYQLLVTEISTSNFRSMHAHEKVGFKTIHRYRDPMDEWNVVVWDWS